MKFSISRLIEVFNTAINNYHIKDDVDQAFVNPFNGEAEELYYHKCWIDTVQWHLEDIIRDANINPVKALEIKRRIDKSNQVRTDMVELIDEQIRGFYKDVNVKSTARLNTESPAWAIDRLSILMLKIYHMQEQVNRENVDQNHKDACAIKLAILKEQEKDLGLGIEQLLENISQGNIYMKVYKQMKMYNDPKLNPVLYKSSK